MKQVITIEAGGVVSGLQRKPGQGLNLQKLGHAKTTRASEIVWDEDAQAWKIDVLQEAGRGVVTIKKIALAFNVVETDTINAVLATFPPYRIEQRDDKHILLFDSYDDAVKVEIAYLDALRLKGQF